MGADAMGIKFTTSSRVDISRQGDECKNCRISRLFGADIVECREKKDCDWVMHFSHSRFCIHPSALQYVN